LKYPLLIALLVTSFLSWSQESREAGKDAKSFINRLKKTKSRFEDRADSLSLPASDSLKTKSASVSDSLTLPAFDSLKTSLTLPDTLAGLKGSLETGFNVASLTDSVKGFSNPLDTLKKPALPGDSLRNEVSTHIEGTQQKISESTDAVQNKAEGVQTKIEDKATSVQQKAEEKVNKLSGKEVDLGKGETSPDINGIQVPDVGLPGNTQLPQGSGLSTPELNTDVKLPETGNISQSINPDLPKMTDVKLPDGIESVTEKVGEAGSKLEKVGEVKNEVKGIKENGLDGVKDLPKTAELEKITSKTEEVNKLTEEAGQYKDQVKEIKETGIEDLNTESLEEEVSKMSGVKELDAQTKKAKELAGSQTAMLQRYSDKKLIQAELKRKSANVVNDQMKDFMPSIKAKQADMVKAKKLSGNVVQTADSVKKIKRENAMKGKPFRNRIVPGVTMQTFNGNGEMLFDLGPQIGYRVTGRLTMGVGGVYRVGVGKVNPSWVEDKDTYGYRVYSDFALIKGFFGHAEFESLNKPVQSPLSPQEIDTQDAKGINIGLGKKYTISSRVKGSLMGMYRCSLTGDLPGQSKFAVRMGFDYVFKKPKAK